MLTSTLPRFAGDMQANFVGEQAAAWLAARPGDEITILAPGDVRAPRSERHDRLAIERYSYFAPARMQGLAYPAILPNIKGNPLLALQLPGLLVAQYRAARRLVAQRRVDLTYAHWIMPQGLVAWLLWRRTGVPYILQNHSSDLAVFNRFGSPGRKLAAMLLRDCARFFCVNRTQLAQAREFLPEELRSRFDAKAAVLPMGIAPVENVSTGASDGYDIVTIGRLSRKKGIDSLIAAAELLAGRGIRPRIAIAGDGEDRDRLRALVRAADVTFTGFLHGDEKEAFLASSKRFAFPAKSHGGDVEGLPVALLEAIAQGKPVLASRDTNIELLPEWDRLREAVVLVEDSAEIDKLADAIEHLLQVDPARVVEAAATIRRYEWKALIHEYLGPIMAAVGGR